MGVGSGQRSSRGGDDSWMRARLSWRRRDHWLNEPAAFVVQTQLRWHQRDDRSGLRHHGVAGLDVVERDREQVMVRLECVVHLCLLVDLHRRAESFAPQFKMSFFLVGDLDSE